MMHRQIHFSVYILLGENIAILVIILVPLLCAATHKRGKRSTFFQSYRLIHLICLIY